MDNVSDTLVGESIVVVHYLTLLLQTVTVDSKTGSRDEGEEHINNVEFTTTT